MRVLIINTSERTGGAAVAAHRLMEALNNNGVQAKMLVRDKESNKLTVVALPSSWRLQWHFLWERFCIWLHLHLRREHLFDIDIANAGTDITKLREFQEANIIHLHWINQGMLSLKDIRKILTSGKRVVWTMHDMWPATAICHYARGCTHYQIQCRNCPLLPNGGGDNDLASLVWNRKKRMLENHKVSFVACSRWLENEAKHSALLAEHRMTNIPNAIDTRVFHPINQTDARIHFGLPTDKLVILFVSHRVTDERKGMAYFIEAIEKLAMRHPTLYTNAVVAIMGGHAEDLAKQLALPVFPLGYVSQSQAIVMAYNAANVFVLPSLEDNLPNTLMEAMACGVPCVGFKVGGIPEMINHLETGYVAAYQDTSDLAKGIYWTLKEANTEEIRKACLTKVTRNYSQQSVAQRYIEIYESPNTLKP